ncbi:MAG: Subunit of the glycosylphosphatidylinositol transamidase complex-like protein [Peltula sp. TS41687]|nr:MAG: Subunit of the glycosylphosphatidylinositol transamidase complex-like protein [Peltula sp. TS41687]
MILIRSFLTFLFSLLLLFFTPATASDYHERLLLQPLPPSNLLASFNFRSNESYSAVEKHNYRLFPRSLGQILQHANTLELHLRFTLGRWDAETWGARPWDGAKEGGTGVELWAWVEAGSEKEADARWTTLTNALSGLFCASLNFIDSTRTIRPRMSFQPMGSHAPPPSSSNKTLSSSSSRLHLLHGTLPREPVCTENLTPFLKLLPCKGRAGISSLLDGHRLFDASWQSMSIDVRPVCPSGDEGGAECRLEIDQTVDMVLDIERSKRHRDDPIPRPVPVEELVCDTSKPYASNDACYPLDYTSEQPWSLMDVFGRKIKGVCPLTDDDVETVCINVPPEREVHVQPGAIERKAEDGYSRCYQLPANEEFDMVLPKQTLNTQVPLSQPPLYAERSFTGYGQERGGVRTILKNPSAHQAVEFVYLESLPWFMRAYLHTLSAKLIVTNPPNREQGQPKRTSTASPPNDEKIIIKNLYYRPALDRHRPTHLEIRMVVPANSTVSLTYDFEKAILRYTEYPPDANRGFDIPPAIIHILPPDDNNNTTHDDALDRYHHRHQQQQQQTYIRTTTLLLSLPTPDFSMPYNVIILTSTVMALAFGSIFNLLVRRFVGADEVDRSRGLRGLLRMLVARGRLVLSKGVRKLDAAAAAGLKEE